MFPTRGVRCERDADRAIAATGQPSCIDDALGHVNARRSGSGVPSVRWPHMRHVSMVAPVALTCVDVNGDLRRTMPVCGYALSCLPLSETGLPTHLAPSRR